MRKTAGTLLLIAACFGPGAADADGVVSEHRHVGAGGCAFQGRPYGDGQFCSLTCSRGACATQTCHHGRWVSPPATCPQGFGCPAFC
jgi:hypothetical protein